MVSKLADIVEAPTFSPFTAPASIAAAPETAAYHRSMLGRDRAIGTLGGAALGGLAGKYVGGLPGAAVGALLGGGGGYLAGDESGRERAYADVVGRARKIQDAERAQEHRKELVDVKDTLKKKTASTLDGVMLHAMSEELAAIHREKVAINLAPVGQFLGNMASKATTAAPKVMGALGQLGGHVVGGLETAGRAALDRGGHLGAAGGKLLSGLGTVEKSLGTGLAGTRAMNQLAGAGAVGAGALGLGATGLAANRMLRGPQQTTVNVQR